MYITLLKILVTISISVVGYPNLQGPFQISSFGPFIPRYGRKVDTRQIGPHWEESSHYRSFVALSQPHPSVSLTLEQGT